MKRYRSSIIVAILFFAIWQALAMYIDAMYILPSPTAILEKIWELKDILFLVHLPATLLITIEGLLISIVLGVVLAAAMNISERIRKQGGKTKGPSKRRKEQDDSFEKCLYKVLREYMLNKNN